MSAVGVNALPHRLLNNRVTRFDKVWSGTLCAIAFAVSIGSAVFTCAPALAPDEYAPWLQDFGNNPLMCVERTPYSSSCRTEGRTASGATLSQTITVFFRRYTVPLFAIAVAFLRWRVSSLVNRPSYLREIRQITFDIIRESYA